MMMKNKKMEGIQKIHGSIREILLAARSHVTRTVDATMVQAYWHIGRIIVEEEQQGKKRAEYGRYLIKELAVKLTAEFGRGFDPSNLKRMRQFYARFPISAAARRQLAAPRKGAAVRHLLPKSLTPVKSVILRSELSWTHYKLLLKVKKRAAREWYMHEAADQGWSTRALERQINSFYYDRILASKKKGLVKKEAAGKIAKLAPENVLKDPYVLEFLGLPDRSSYRETELEQALIDQLQGFLLELGKGFSFVERQKRIRAEDDDFYIDLVFYNYLLKCFVLIDLKIGKLTHQDIGQIDMYVRMYEDQYKVTGDNPPIGIILCSEKNRAVARYSVLHGSKRLFASRYQLYLPTEAELSAELKRERKLLELRGATGSGRREAKK